MTDRPEFTDFGSSEKLLEYFKEKSDDIEKVIIVPPGTQITYEREPVTTLREFQMMICLINDQRKMIGQKDAELLLNDGILSRMKLRIEFMVRPV